MRKRSVIKGACTRCINVLGPKPLCAYTDYDRNLRIQRSTLQKFADDYDLYVSHQKLVRDWVIEFDGRGTRFQNYRRYVAVVFGDK